MHVTIEITGTEEPSELHALAALIHVLGGRVPCLPQSSVTGPVVPKELEGREITVQIDGGNITYRPDQIMTLPSTVIVPPPPPPVIVPNVPAPPATLPPASAGAVGASARDVNGLPWDERIHSSNREPNADGSWRKRRGVSDELVRSVTAELLGRAAPLAPPPPPPPTATTSMTFPQLAASIGQRRGGTGYTYAELNELATMIGLTTFRDLMQRHDLIDTFVGMLEA